MTRGFQKWLGPRDLMVAGVMNVLWGLNIVAVKMAVESIAPMTAAALRQAIVFIVCASALKIVPGRMRALLALGVLSGGLFYICINLSLAVSDNVPALAIAGQLGVPFSLLLAVFVLKERIHGARIAGIALSIAGVVLLVFDPSAGKEMPGLLLTAASSCIWAISSLIQRQLIGVPVLTIYAWIGLAGFIMLAPIAVATEPAAVAALPHLPLRDLGWVLFSAIGSTVIGHGSMSWLLQRHPVSTIIPLTLASPIISVVTASIFFRIPITVLMVVGGVTALVGVAIVTIRTARADYPE